MRALTRDDDFYPFGFSGRYGAVSAMEKPHRHHEIELFYVASGSCSRTLGEKTYRFSQGSLLLFWGAYPHQLLTPPKSCLILYIPLRFFLNWSFEPTFLQQILHGNLAVIPESDETRDIIQLFKKRILDGKITHLSQATEREIQSQFLYLADFVSGHPEAWGMRSESVPAYSDHLSRIFEYVVENFGSPMNLADLGRACNLHPNYVWHVFRKATGKTPSEYLTEYRLSHARELLHRTDRKIVDIALASGFGSVSQFYALFSKSCGMSPKNYRRMAGRGAAISAA